jgi:hypothetical protein
VRIISAPGLEDISTARAGGSKAASPLSFIRIVYFSFSMVR